VVRFFDSTVKWAGIHQSSAQLQLYSFNMGIKEEYYKSQARKSGIVCDNYNTGCIKVLTIFSKIVVKSVTAIQLHLQKQLFLSFLSRDPVSCRESLSGRIQSGHFDRIVDIVAKKVAH
jgi:hypothetical protein